METSELSTPLVVLAVVGLAAFLVFKLVQGARQKAEERRAALRLLGFAPAADPGRDDAALIALCRRSEAGRYEVHDLLERRAGDDRILLFDLKDRSGDSDRPSLLAVVSPRLDMPRFKLFPRIESEGPLAALANSFLEKVMAHAGRAVTFPEEPAFSRRYTVVGTDEDAIRAFFDRERLGELAEKEGLVIDAAGDAFTIDRFRLGGRQQSSGLSDVSERVELAERLLRLFSRRR